MSSKKIEAFPSDTIRAMFNATGSLAYLFDREGKILDTNKEGALLFSKTPEEIIGKNMSDILKKNDFKRIYSLADKVFRSKESLNYKRERNGRFFEVTLSPIFNSKNEAKQICMFARDITDLKRTEKALAAVETAGKACHEMNQPLQVILGNIALLKRSIKEDDPANRFLNTLTIQTNRLRKITEKLTHLTRHETKKHIKGTVFDIDQAK